LFYRSKKPVLKGLYSVEVKGWWAEIKLGPNCPVAELRASVEIVKMGWK
jgi:hypothetical protein